jgi:hypothetical protein
MQINNLITIIEKILYATVKEVNTSNFEKEIFLESQGGKRADTNSEYIFVKQTEKSDIDCVLVSEDLISIW